MNQNEFLSQLEWELRSLPEESARACLALWRYKFEQGLAEGKSEQSLCEQFPKPSLIASQLRTSLRYEHLKSDFSMRKLFQLFFTLIGLLILNGLMMIPAFMLTVAMSMAYLGSLIVYGVGVVIVAVSLSGLDTLKFKFPSGHISHTYSSAYDMPSSEEVHLVFNEKGLQINKHDVRSWQWRDRFVSDAWRKQWRSDAKWVTIKNQLDIRYLPVGLLVLVLGTGLLLLCLGASRASWFGLKRYLAWNLALLRAPLQTARPLGAA